MRHSSDEEYIYQGTNDDNDALSLASPAANDTDAESLDYPTPVSNTVIIQNLLVSMQFLPKGQLLMSNLQRY